MIEASPPPPPAPLPMPNPAPVSPSAPAAPSPAPGPPAAKTCRIAAVADLHAHKAHTGEFKALAAELAGNADLLLLAGDLTNLGLSEEAEALATDLSVLRMPLL